MAMAREREGKEKSMTIKQRVRAGIRFLDKIYGRKAWKKKLKLDILDLADSFCCILGQTDSDFESHVKKLGLTDYGIYKLGFYVDSNIYKIHKQSTWDHLTAAWKEELRKI